MVNFRSAPTQKICFGLGKHGDSSETRGNKRSPWDTMHPGREWAADITENQKEPELILRQIEAHLSANQPYSDIHAIFDQFITDMRQLSAERFYVASEEAVIPSDEETPEGNAAGE